MREGEESIGVLWEIVSPLCCLPFCNPTLDNSLTSGPRSQHTRVVIVGTTRGRKQNKRG